MRELKFRVWDNKNKKFLPESHFAILGSGKVIVTLSGYYEHFTNKTQDDYVVQQYTGLQDSTGKEIYEGDIIKETHFEDWKDETGYDYFGVVKRVVYTDNNGHQVSAYSSFPKLQAMTGYAGNPIGVKCEVVGNIFGFPCRPDHNGECLICDCWLTDCPMVDMVKRDKAKKD